MAQIFGRAVKDNLTTTLTGSWTHVDDPIGSHHHLWIMLNHHQRIAGITQSMHHINHALHVFGV